VLLEAARRHWSGLPGPLRERFRFIHVSTDEVYGSLDAEGQSREGDPYAPSSPYSASKAGSDHLALAWGRTYGLPVIVTNCSNNYGPRQFPEKLVPLMILAGLEGRPMPVYGDGLNVRDWLHVDDHVRALVAVLRGGRPGARYHIGGDCERTNLEMVGAIAAGLDRLRPAGAPHARLIRHVPDRPGHDRRYALDAGLIRRELGWSARIALDTGLADTIGWYLAERDRWAPPEADAAGGWPVSAHPAGAWRGAPPCA
jgi:dTDP-glucose 4,6-dehydratase